MKAQIIYPNQYGSKVFHRSNFFKQNKIFKLFLYKIFTEEENKLFIAEGYSKGSMADIQDGFIHFSEKYQLFETIYKHFNNLETIYIYSFFMESLDTNLKWEISRNGEYFPHYYGLLSLRDTIYFLKIKI